MINVTNPISIYALWLFIIKIMEEVEGFEPPQAFTPLSVFKTDPFSRTWVYLRINNYMNAVDHHNKTMEEVEGFEPPRAFTPLSVFKTDPFSRTWVFLQNYMDLAGLEPATGRL